MFVNLTRNFTLPDEVSKFNSVTKLESGEIIFNKNQLEITFNKSGTFN